MRRVRVSWDGLGALPGVSTFYYGVASPNVSDLVTFFTAIRSLVPSGLTWTIPNTGDELDDATGQLTGTWSGSGGGTVTSNGGSVAYAAGVGVAVNWTTGVIVGRRRVQGRTFLCPLVSSAYSTNGSIAGGNLTTIGSAAAAFVASGVAKGIWHRPRNGSGGQYAAINFFQVPNRVTALRSRRY